jgi:uroporphyrin-III C-methyltransferase/precorrin-2 dehydrogenase/sirohydrochlorin ferrochelatase
MPARTLAALVVNATAAGLDPTTPAMAVACATCPDQQIVAATVSDLPARVAAVGLPGPCLVMIGQSVASAEVLEQVPTELFSRAPADVHEALGMHGA